MRTNTLYVFLIAIVTGPVFGQTTAGEISAGWSFLHSLDASSVGLDEFENFPLGFHVGGAGRLTDSIAIAGDLGWNRKSLDIFGIDSKLTFTSFSVGPRFYFGERVTGFVHALVGGIRLTGSASGFGEEFSESTTELMIMPGGGVDVRVSNALAIRLQGDYQWVDAEDTDGNVRFVAAAVFNLGER